MISSKLKALSSYNGSRAIELALLTTGLVCFLFVGMQCVAAEQSGDSAIDRTQMQLDFIADVAMEQASLTKGSRENINRSVVSAMRGTELHDGPALALKASGRDRLLNEWGGSIKVFGAREHLVIEYAGVPSALCSSKLFDYARQSYVFKCNDRVHITKVVVPVTRVNSHTS